MCPLFRGFIVYKILCRAERLGLVADASRDTSSRTLLQQLHWLPAEARITYKLCTVMYLVLMLQLCNIWLNGVKSD